jgi:lysozyme
MRSWLIIVAGAIVLLFFGTTARAMTFKREDDMTPVSWYSENAIASIKREEGLSLTAYADAGGWSIGYGHYLGLEKTIEKITQDVAESYLTEDMANAAQMILDNVTVPLSQNQFDALTSFFYNLGSRALKGGDGESSTWLTLLNSGDYDGAAAQLIRWAHSEGRHNPVLAQRREREKELFLTA